MNAATGMQRRSDRHAKARGRYEALVQHDDSPQLPAGYSTTMFVLALLLPLWFRVMDHRARAPSTDLIASA